MLPVLGKPITERVIERLIEVGFREFILVVNPDDYYITAHFQNYDQPQIRIQIVHQENPSGTAHALRRAAPFLRDDFLLTACDNLVPKEDLAKYLQTWRSSQPMNGLLALLPVTPDQIPRTAIVELNGSQIIRIIEKPSLKDAPSDIASLPLYIFSPSILGHLARLTRSNRGEYELQEVIQKLINAEGEVYGYPVSRRITLTTPQDLLAINLDYLRQGVMPMQVILANQIGDGTRIIPPVFIEAGVQIGTKCTIGPEVYLESGCQLGERCEIQRAVMLSGVSLGAGESASDCLLYPPFMS